MSLQAVIFDYGLVLSGPAEPSARMQLLEISGLPPDVFDTHYWKHRLDYDRGTLNGRTYWQTIARDTDRPFTAEQIDALIHQDILLWATVNPIMLDWVVRVRAAGMKTAILSNMGQDLLAHMRNNFLWLDDFHHLTWSCELDMIKPEARIYRHTLDKLNVKPEAALFLDDKPENIEGARLLGMHAVLFSDPRTLQTDLQNAGWTAQLPPVFG